MEMMHPEIILIGLGVMAAAFLVLLIIRKRRDTSFKDGIKAANTESIRNTPVYRKLLLRYKILRALLITGLTGAVISSLFLASRIFKTDNITSGVKKRDIIFCLDVSYSLYDLNHEITDYLKGVVKGLAGDRIGINIFNTATVTYVPLTDDYDYLWERLDELGEYFKLQKEYVDKYYGDKGNNLTSEQRKEKNELRSRLDYMDAGTLFNNDFRGSSLIGEGLGTALYSFPYLGESDRTRVIIMCTDNELNNFQEEVMTLSEAAAACQKNKVTVFGLFPKEEIFYQPNQYDYSKCYGEFKSAVELTGGKSYIRTNDMPVTEIVSDIQKQEAMLVKVIMSNQKIDTPEVAFIILLLFMALATTVGLVLQK
ncbi:MAG: hypothetical protein IK152_03205 [Lachnospiraceae bacterium]|nr:hypothetical protein [Lachnospiraceae bacterium]